MSSDTEHTIQKRRDGKSFGKSPTEKKKRSSLNGKTNPTLVSSGSLATTTTSGEGVQPLLTDRQVGSLQEIEVTLKAPPALVHLSRKLLEDQTTLLRLIEAMVDGETSRSLNIAKTKYLVEDEQRTKSNNRPIAEVYGPSLLDSKIDDPGQDLPKASLLGGTPAKFAEKPDIIDEMKKNHGKDSKVKKQSMFVDVDDWKQSIQANAGKIDYKVENKYKTTGLAQRIARSPIFENFTLFVVCLNIWYIPVDAQFNKADDLVTSEWYFQVVEQLFCSYFTTEWVVRFVAFKHKVDCTRDPWFVFDTILVAEMILETWIFYLVSLSGGSGNLGASGVASLMRVMRMGRMLRMGRMAKLLRMFPEIAILIKGLFLASRTVFFTLVLLGVVIFVFGVTLFQFMEGTPSGDVYFENVASSFYTLLLMGVLPDVSAFVLNVGQDSPVGAFLCLLFVLLGSLTVMNMLLGVLVEVVSAVSHVEKEQIAIHKVQAVIMHTLGEQGLAQDSDLAKGDYLSLLASLNNYPLMKSIGVDIIGMAELSDFVFKDGPTITVYEFIQMLLKMRGSKVAMVKDIVDLRKFISMELTQFTRGFFLDAARRGSRSSLKKFKRSVSFSKW